jgi:hypothetical protein
LVPKTCELTACAAFVARSVKTSETPIFEVVCGSEGALPAWMTAARN